jgi:multiple sugar transport system substrate-binding protein
MTSPSISLQRVMLPYALRDPYRLSHFASEDYRAQWPTAGAYLDTLQAAADGALVDIIMPGSAEYQTAIDQAVTSGMSGTPVEEALAVGNAAFNEITDRIGRESQIAAYENFKALPGSYYSE